MADASSSPSAQVSSRKAASLRIGALALLASLATAVSLAQQPAQPTGFTDSGSTAKLLTNQVTDPKGTPIAGAKIRHQTGALLGVTDSTGHLTISCAAPCPVTVESTGFETRQALWQSPDPIALSVASFHQAVSITAYRTPLGDLESPVSTRVLTTTDLEQAASITLDGQIRLVPGVETFRRSSSLVANPTSQGLSLRGLGSTSASRTLVTSDDVPLNDAFGGWIHWQELPELTIRSVELVRGGASDLYGSSAIGGVVNVIPIRPTDDQFVLKSSYGSEGTYEDSALLEGRRHHWGAIASGGAIGTDGFIQLNPANRGLVDIRSNVHSQNGLALVDRQNGPLRIFLRGSGMNESRSNGTPVTNNGTRLIRFATGGDWSAPQGSQLTLRAYGSTEHYRQTFSTIAGDRNSELLNRFVKTPDNEMGAVFHWSQPFGPHLLAVFGADTHDVRSHDDEIAIRSGVQSFQNISDRQRQTGAYAEALYTRDGWTASGSARLDWFSNFDSLQFAPTVATLPHLSEHVFDPRLGVSRKLGSHFAVSGTGFRAYRAPTPNELYRSTQVGSLLTLPNNALSSERATGWETGLAMEQKWGTVRTSYFWTQVNHPITALTTNPNSSPIQLKRENLGQIESRGVSLDYEVQPLRWMTLQGGYQYTNATVTKYRQQPNLVDNWIPQVAHNTGSAQLRAYKPKLGVISLQAKLSGRQFDDDANIYLLHGYFKLDAYASHDFGTRIELFSSAENLFDRDIDVGRTPLLTIGTPRTVRAGFRLKLSPAGN
jgi:outer membrane receptor protein involved in Fe transport